MDKTIYRGRFDNVLLAARLARHNHILQAIIRCAWSHIYQNGFTIEGPILPELVQNIYVGLVRDAISSLYTVGYFAIVIEYGRPMVLEPERYIVVARGDLPAHLEQPDDYTVIFLKQSDCDRFRPFKPLIYIQYAPQVNGQLTCPSMQVIDMHDAIIEFCRLALLNDGINLRPKAWISERQEKNEPGVYRYLTETQVDLPSRDPLNAVYRRNALNRRQADSYIESMNMLRSEKMQTGMRPFADTCLSRTVEFNSTNDPSLMVEVRPNLEITPMTTSHTRQDLVDLIRLFDQRMCNALGIPPTLIGLPSPNNVSNHDDEAVRNWENSINPYRSLLNMALSDCLNLTLVKEHAKLYKKTHDRHWLQPIRIEIVPSLNYNRLLSLQPFLTPAAFRNHLAKNTGLPLSDFRTDLFTEKDEKEKNSD